MLGIYMYIYSVYKYVYMYTLTCVYMYTHICVYICVYLFLKGLKKFMEQRITMFRALARLELALA